MSTPSSCSNPGCASPGAQHCHGCKEVPYCSPACQETDWPAHKVQCKGTNLAPPTVDAVILCATQPDPHVQNSSIYEATKIPLTHSIFNNSPTPISQKLRYPLVVERLYTRPFNTTNLHATWLMIGPKSRKAPVEWQDIPFDVLVARADKEPLAVDPLREFADYIDELLIDSEPTEECTLRIEEEFYSGEKLRRLHRKLFDRAGLQSSPTQGPSTVTPELG